MTAAETRSGRVVFWLALLTLILCNGSLLSQGIARERTPDGVVPLFPKTPSRMAQFASDSTLFRLDYFNFRREARLDTTESFLIIEEHLFDRPYRLPVMVDLDYYIQQRIRHDKRQEFYAGASRNFETFQTGGSGGIELNIPVRIRSKAFKRIFGGDRVGLRVSGNITFELAGRTESREGSAVSSIEERGNFAPKFKQTQQFRVEGRVGDKVTVSVDQNSEATFDFENTLKLTYEGDEDEIVQRIEAGNVALSLPSTNYVSTSANHQGLFGLKTEMQVGNFSFTGIASLERGENEKLSVTGSSRENTRRIKDYEYVRDQFFFVDTVYKNLFENIDTERMQLIVDPNLKIRRLDVWRTVNANSGEGRDNTFPGVAVINPRQYQDGNRADIPPTDIPGEVERGRFQRLNEGDDYEVDFQRGYIRLKSRATETEILAVSYSFGPATSPQVVGDLAQSIDSTASDSTEILLRLIKPQSSKPEYTKTWPLAMRNVYNLGAAGISSDGFDVKVLFTKTGEDQEVDSETGRTYNYMLGLDRVNEQGAPVEGGDKNIDLSKGFIFDRAGGYLIFPSLNPFDPGIYSQNGNLYDPILTELPDERRVKIYNIKTRTEELRESQFDLEITTTSSSSSFDLGFNVLEGSEQVKLNGRILERDKDYIIDYFSGKLEITAQEARRADAQIDIEYERGALFQLDKKTLLGGRLDYNFGERNFIGLTTLFYSKSTLDQRVRLGQEPIRNFIWNVNTAMYFKPNFLTTIFDKLPIVETSAESKLKIEAEYAQVNPNPNTFNEPDLGDNDGVAYIDDFEGSKRFTSLGIQYRVWTPASVPLRFQPVLGTARGHRAPSDAFGLRKYILDQEDNRVDFNWFNPFDQVPIRSIWPERDVNTQTGTTTSVLTLRWQNDDVPVDSAWAGVMRSTLSFADQQKTKFIEMWVKGNNGQINIDVGRISEDYWVKGNFPNPDVPGDSLASYRNLNTEDVNFNGLLDVEEGEDTGIDGIAGADGANVPGDAGNDDWADPRATPLPFAGINGTEGNSNAQGARYPDTEDLNGDGIVSLFNDYFAYSFDLSQDEYLVSRTIEPETGQRTGWKLYRIPLRDFRFKVGDPDETFQQVYFVRLWISNLAQAGEIDTIQIAAFDFVGNEWEEEGIAVTDTSEFRVNDEKFSVTVYNTEEHSGEPTRYESPPGVSGIRDRVTQAVSKEQSLVMELKDLPSGARVEARKQFREKVNMLNYRRMKMFMYGRNVNADTDEDTVRFYMRFGPTDEIYYEYRQPVWENWDTRNEVEIDFVDLAATKDDQYLYTLNDPYVPGVPRPDTTGPEIYYRQFDDGSEFIVVGQPGLHNIQYMVMGAINSGRMDLIDEPGRKREIWLDELRLTGVERESGSAMRLATDLGIADVANIRAQWELRDDDFRRLEEQFASTNGQDKTQQKQSYFVSVKFDKFLPESWGMDIPIDGRYTRTLDVPKYFYNSDRRTGYAIDGMGERFQTFFGLSPVPDDLDDQVRFNEQRSVGGTLKRKRNPKDPWYLQFTVNQLTLDLDYSEKSAYSPTVEFDDNTSIRGSMAYSIPFPRDKFIRPFAWLGKSALVRGLANQKFYFMPSSASANATVNDNETLKKNRREFEPTETITVNTTRKFALGYKMFESLDFDYSRDYSSDAYQKGYRAADVVEAVFTKGDFGQDRRIAQRFGANYSPNLFSWLSGNYRYSSDFQYNLADPLTVDRRANLNINNDIRLDIKLATLMGLIWKPDNKPTPPRNRGGRRPPSRGGDQEGDGGKDGEGGKGIALDLPHPGEMLWSLFSSFKSFTVNIRNQDSYSHTNLEGIPSLAYQFGLDPDIPLEERSNTDSNKVLLAPSIRSTETIDGNMQVDLFRNLKVNLKYNQQTVDNQNDRNQTQSVSNTVFFLGDDPDSDTQGWWNYIPDWRVSLSGVEKLPLFRAFTKSASLEHARSGKFSETSRFEPNENDQVTKQRDQWSYSNNYQPFLGLTLNTIWGVTASLRTTRSVTVDYRSAGATTRREQSGVNLTASYSVTKGFRLPLPFLSGKRLNNEIQFQLAFDSNSNANFSKDITDDQFQELDVSDSWKLRPSITYRFSQKVNGTAFYEQSSSSNKRTGTTTYKEFGINVNIAIR